jgi:hypothetical protein
METAGLQGAQAAKLESFEEAPTLHFPKHSNHQPMETSDAPAWWRGSNLRNDNGDGAAQRGWRRVGNGDVDGAMGLAMVRRDGVGDGSGMTMVTVRWGWRHRGIETEGGVDDGDGDGVALREATEAPGEAASREAMA